jgi:predicted aspartyl protease
MGTFRVECRIENPVDRSRTTVVPDLFVDTGSELTWIPARTLESIGIAREKKRQSFLLANGQRLTRTVGFVILHVDGFVTVDEVVFAEPGDAALLGAHSLEGLNLAVDPGARRLIPGGPVPAVTPMLVRRAPRRRRERRTGGMNR